MAVLNKIRQRSVFLIVIIALALFSFVLADLIRNGGAISQKAQNTIATINGEDIDRTDFARKVEAASRNFGPNSSSIQAVNYVWNQEVRQIVFDDQFQEIGVRVGADEVSQLLEEALANNPTFQNEAGVFDKAKMQEYVASIKENPTAYQQWKDYKSSLGKGALEKKYMNMVKAGVGVTLKEGELAYKMENDAVDIKYVQLPYSAIKNEEVTVADSEIQAYISKHAELYKAEASRDFRYVFFKEEPSEADENELKNSIAKIANEFKSAENIEEFVNVDQNSAIKYDDRFKFKKDLPVSIADTLYNLPVGEVYGPYKDGQFMKISKVIAQKQLHDSIKVNHIMISWKGVPSAGDTERTKEGAKTLADSLLAVVKSDNSKFADLAKTYSADTSTKDKGGDLGYINPSSQWVSILKDYPIENEEGSTDVVETDYGYHVVSIEEKKNLQKTVKVATIAQEIEASEKTINEIFTETTKFQIATKDADFEEKAKENEYTVRPVNKLSKMADNVPGLGSQRSIVQWAFNEESKIGDVKRFEVKDGYAVVQLTAKTAKGVQRVEDASASVKPILIKEKKAALLKNKVSGTTLDEIAKGQSQTVKTASALNMKTPTISGAGTEPKVVGAAFALEIGNISEPIIGNNGVYVIEVTKKTPATGLDTYISYASQATTTQANAVNSRVFNALKEAAEIEDKRSNFY